MNIHHLELFYYVAKHGGITPAVRKMPYGIQQPAVSAQLLKLEKNLGDLSLFQRRPFQLSPAGRRLYELVAPFFDRLPDLEAELRGESAERLRIAAPSLVLQEHLPQLLAQHRRAFPRLKVALREANHARAEELLKAQEIDLAVVDLQNKPGPNIRSAVLLKLPPVLIVPASSGIRHAREIFKPGGCSETFISLPGEEALTRGFRERLETLRCDWSTVIEVGSLALVPAYVVRGFGLGLSLRLPGVTLPRTVREVPLPGFPPVVIAALWQHKLSPVSQAFLATIQKYAADLRER